MGAALSAAVICVSFLQLLVARYKDILAKCSNGGPPEASVVSPPSPIAAEPLFATAVAATRIQASARAREITKGIYQLGL